MKPLATWVYFGCGQGSAGHRLEMYRGERLDGDLRRHLEVCDGFFPPHPESSTLLYQAALTRLPGLGCSVLAWWDRSGDTRPGSNSAIFAPSLTCCAESMIEGAKQRWPWAINRLPKPLELWEPS